MISPSTPRLRIALASATTLAALAGCGTPTAPGVADPASAGPAAYRSGDSAVEASSLVTPKGNVAGMNGSRYAPTNRSTFLAVSPDGGRVAIAWLHNDDGGEPTAYATVGNPKDAGSFTAPQVIGTRTMPYAAQASDYHRKYNTAHNAPFIVSGPSGGFLGLSVPMNANGYAQAMPATGYGYMASACDPGRTTFAPSRPAPVDNTAEGSSLSAMSGSVDGRHEAHLFGQGHLGAFQGGFGYQRQREGSASWESVTLAAAYRPGWRYYFGEGSGYVAKSLNDQGRNDLHAAFAWNEQGESPMYGLYYMKSRDGGRSWTNAAGQPLTLPLRHRQNDGPAAVIRADLTSTAYGGEAPGHRSIDVSATDDGRPLIVRPRFTDSTRKSVQHFLYTWAGGRWQAMKVGPSVFWDAAGNGVAYNAKTKNVNVVLLDPGSRARPARVLRYHQSLDDAMGGREKWVESVIATVPTTSYASHLQVREVKNSRFVALFENNYRNPGKVEPLLLEVPMK
ncbi:hypothetical protein D3C72_788670 [compost metagenome]